MKMKKRVYIGVSAMAVCWALSGTVEGIDNSIIYYNNGNFGIGTTTPSSKFHIIDAGIPGLKIESSSTSGDRDAQLLLMVDSQGGNDPAGSVVFNDGGGVRAKITAINNGGSSGGILKFYTDGGGHALVERMRIDDGGRVGIGVSNNPQAKLDVQGGLYWGNYVSSRYNNANYAVAFAATQLNGAPYIGFNTKQSGGSDGSTYDLNGCATALYGDSGSSGGLRIAVAPQGNAGSPITWTTALAVTSVGNVGIGVSSPTQKLEVGGSIKSNDIILGTANWADYVFEPDYKLKPLLEVEAYVKKNRHLESVPSEAEVKEKGVSVGRMNVALLQKVEELTLYVIALSKENSALKKQNHSIEKRVAELEKKLER